MCFDRTSFSASAKAGCPICGSWTSAPKHPMRSPPRTASNSRSLPTTRRSETIPSSTRRLCASNTNPSSRRVPSLTTTCATRERVLRKEQPVLGGYDATQYVSERLHATADDGARVPISLVYRRDTPLDGSAPLLLYGYGSYGHSIAVNFSSNRVSLLDRGVIFAIAHIRGGGELGKPWHDAGRLRQKRNTFTDFIAVGRTPYRATATRHRESLIIEGGSAGGLLMGAVANMRPDLFRMVINHVPFVDVLNTMLDASLPLTVGEYEEWGDPRIAEDYFYMKSYCPYTNLAGQAVSHDARKDRTERQPSHVLGAGEIRGQVAHVENRCESLLFKTNMGAGHGGASGRYDYLREIALDYAFLLTELGIRE